VEGPSRVFLHRRTFHKRVSTHVTSRSPGGAKHGRP
jgi:hypothetical protein